MNFACEWAALVMFLLIPQPRSMTAHIDIVAAAERFDAMDIGSSGSGVHRLPTSNDRPIVYTLANVDRHMANNDHNRIKQIDHDIAYSDGYNFNNLNGLNRVDSTPSIGGDDDDDASYPPPIFDFGMPRNITARTGQTAAISCRVENLGDKSVSWIRKRDLHILTAGILTYTSDERFQVVRATDSNDWSLHVRYAQPRDSGIYECQVNTEPKISMAFHLNVIVTSPDAKAVITGPQDLYAKVGSAITLTCYVKKSSTATRDIGPIHWYRGPYILTPFASHPHEAAIDMQRISTESKLGEKLQSRLRIANAQTADSGNYTCMPTTAEAASVTVNVINDESPAAMQKSSAPHRQCLSPAIGFGVGIIAVLLVATNVSRCLHTFIFELLSYDHNNKSHQCRFYHRHYHCTSCHGRHHLKGHPAARSFPTVINEAICGHQIFYSTIGRPS